MNRAQALAFLDNLMVQHARDDHLIAVDRKVFMRHAAKVDSSFLRDVGRALILERYLRNSPEVVVYQKHEVGCLMRFESRAVGSTDGMAPIGYLLKVPSLMRLNNAQTRELEFLLQKAGRTLGIELPHVQAATDVEKAETLAELDMPMELIQAKPRPAYEKFREMMKVRGTPVNMTPKEFVAFVNSYQLK